MTTRIREIYPARMIGNELVGMPGIFAQTGADLTVTFATSSAGANAVLGFGSLQLVVP